MSLTQALEKLVAVIESRGYAIRQYLQPGLSRDAIDSKVRHLGLHFPEEFYELYQWHNGMELYQADCLIFGEHEFPPLEIALAEHQELLKYYASTNINLFQCFPIAMFNGSYHAVYCSDALFYGLRNPIIEIFEGICIAFENVGTMIDTATEWYANGIYDEHSFDETRWRAIAKRFNSHIPDLSTSL